MRRLFPLLFVGLLLTAIPVGAQTLGTITGEVKDSSGAIIPGATVTATNTATNATREAQSNEAGAYSFPALPPGPYIVKAELQGFRTVTQEVRAARRADGPRQLHAGDRHAVGDRRSHRRGAAHHDGERHGRHGHREQAHRRAAAERPQLPVARRAQPERQRRVRGRRAGRRPPGRLARQPAALDLGPAARVQLLHARRHGQHRRQLQHLHSCCRRSTRSKSSRCRRASTRPSSAAPPAR